MKNTHNIVLSNIRRRKLTDRTILFEYYCKQKLSLRKIAKILNVSSSTIQRTLKRMKIKIIPFHRYINFFTKQKLKELHYKQKLLLIEIAKKYNCNINVIQYYMNKFNIKVLQYRNQEKNRNWRGGKPKCKDCGKTLSSYGPKRCGLCHNIWSQIPKNNPNYIHGKCYAPYNSQWNKNTKEKIRKRDNFKCSICNKKQRYLRGYHKKLSIHHIDYNKQNCKENNLIALCAKCHIKTNFNRDYWYAYFIYMMTD
jgi:predicted DNA-binding protein YlxM (UPF0122 family)